MKAYITDSEIRDIIDKKDYTRLATNPKIRPNDLKVLQQWRKIIPEYVKDYVIPNKFLQATFNKGLTY